MADIFVPPTPVEKYWEGQSNLFGANLNQWTSWFESSHGLINNLRYACRNAVGYLGSPDPVLDAERWPTVAPGEQARIYMFTGVSVPGVYLDGTADTDLRLQKMYRPGKYIFEVTTAEGVASPLDWFGGDGSSGWSKVSDGAVGVAAVYEVNIPADGRTNAGIEIILTGGITLTDLVIYHEDDAALDHDEIKWADNFVESISRLTHVRDMNLRFGNEDGARIGTIADLPKLSWCNWSGVGPPEEAIVPLCNAANVDYYQMIPAEAALNVTYIRNRAIYVRDNLKPELRVWPFVGNEVWNGDGLFEYDSFKSSYIFQQEHTVTLGLPTTFTGRMQAQAHAQRLVIDTYKNVFAASDPDRVVALVETQIGNAGPIQTKLQYVYPDGKTLGDILKQYSGYVMVAPYFITLDTTPYYNFVNAVSASAQKSFLDNMSELFWTGFQTAFNSAKTTRSAVGALYSGIKIGTYEGIFQEGIPSEQFVPDWEAGAPAQPFLGMARYYDAQFLPGERRIFFSKVASPNFVTFDYSEWTETTGKRIDDYTAGELESTAKAMAFWRGNQSTRDRLGDMMDLWRTEFDSPFTLYKLFGLPNAAYGSRGVTAEREEPNAKLVWTSTAALTVDSGPWATFNWLLDVSLRPNGELPGEPPTPGTPGLDLGVGGPFVVPPFPGRPGDDGDGGDDGGDDGGGDDGGGDDGGGTTDPGNDGEDPGTGVLTSLTAVNDLLAAVHRAPITTLANPDREVQIAINCILRAEREIQQRGWHWNVLYGVEIEPDEDGKIKLPVNTLAADAFREKTDLNLTQRGDFMFDVEGQTFEIGQTVYLKITYQLAYDDLPIFAKSAVVTWAAVLFEEQVQGDPYIGRVLRGRYLDSMAVMEAVELENEQFNLLTSPPMGRVLNRHFY